MVNLEGKVITGVIDVSIESAIKIIDAMEIDRCDFLSEFMAALIRIVALELYKNAGGTADEICTTLHKFIDAEILSDLPEALEKLSKDMSKNREASGEKLH